MAPLRDRRYFMPGWRERAAFFSPLRGYSAMHSFACRYRWDVAFRASRPVYYDTAMRRRAA